MKRDVATECCTAILYSSISFNVNLSRNWINKHQAFLVSRWLKMSHQYINRTRKKVISFQNSRNIIFLELETDVDVLPDRWEKKARHEIVQERVKDGDEGKEQNRGEREKFSSLASSRVARLLLLCIGMYLIVVRFAQCRMSSDRCHKVTERSYVQTSVYSESPSSSST